MTYIISKDFAFSASHQLNGLDPKHKCGRLHGHNFVVRVELSADALDATGFVVDYGDLAPFGQWIDENLDHSHLNDGMIVNPTAECLAYRLLLVLRDRVILPAHVTIAGIGVSETPKTWAWWRP